MSEQAPKPISLPDLPCPNCHDPIPAHVFQLHTVHCQRFLTKCEQCGDKVNRNMLSEHVATYHATAECEFCGSEFSQTSFPTHTETCERRPQPCQYCEAVINRSQRPAHEEQCGARTELCETCGNYVAVKCLFEHSTICIPDTEIYEVESSSSSEDDEPEPRARNRRRVNGNKRKQPARRARPVATHAKVTGRRRIRRNE